MGLLLYYFVRKAEKAQQILVQELRKEIDRMAESRNKLETKLLRNRLSSDDGVSGNE